MKIVLESWEDGQLTRKTLTHLDRWTLQAAHQLHLTCCDDVDLTFDQRPQQISGKKIGVAAVCWDGALVLASYLTGRYGKEYWQGKSVLELGAGVGLIGILLSALHAEVTLTDKAKVIPLLDENISRNSAITSTRAKAVALEWGKVGWQVTAQALGQLHTDFIVAADCVYLDQDGESPSTESFVEACHLISGEATLCYIAFESRVQPLRETFVQCANRVFKQVQVVPQDCVAEGFRAEHIEIFLLKGKL